LLARDQPRLRPVRPCVRSSRCITQAVFERRVGHLSFSLEGCSYPAPQGNRPYAAPESPPTPVASRSMDHRFPSQPRRSRARVKIARHGCVASGALEGHRSMNRISIRGVGTAAAAVAATALAVGAHVPSADAQEPATHASHAPLLTMDVLVTTGNTAITFPAPSPATTASSSSAAELALIRAARPGALAFSTSIQAGALASARLLSAQQKAADRASRIRASITASRSLATRPAPPTYGGSVQALGEKMAAARGWTGVQWRCLDDVWTHESGWSVSAQNASGAFGIPQASPGSKMASAGPDWRTNPATQIAWGLSYISGAYGTPCGAWSFWQQHFWY